jgi:peroxiredoxin
MLRRTRSERTTVTLSDEVDALTAANKVNANPERTAVYGKAAAALAETDLLERALGVGDTAPMFELPDALGNQVALADLLADGPVIVSFYRGEWCPYCNLELNALQRELANAHAAGVKLIAISPNKPDESLSLVEKHELAYPVLSDSENAVAKQFNIVFEMEEGLVDFYKGIGRNIDEMNASDVWELPVPATYVIDVDGVIRYAFVDLNHRVRAEPAEVVAAAAALVA